ncbi:dNTP triphosphohydrolase [bacterium]|nr:dNTP triphosphohydrolase [bacterium]
MQNSFYNSFDTEVLHSAETRSKYERTPFQQDRDRIIHSSSFRRLQAKTQVFFSGEYDFYRTRLTHSIEVAQIGRSICHCLQLESGLLDEEFFIDPELVEAICLSHDIGHPPFGHAGEDTLNLLMKNLGGFEGNAQTLRILTETIYSGPADREGMNPTRALIDGVMKYKMLYQDMIQHGQPPRNHFLYNEQEKYTQFIFGAAVVPLDLREEKNLNTFRSVECQIMDWADDTAYSINDVMDGIAAGLITVEKIEQWAKRQSLNPELADSLSSLLDAIHKRELNRFFARKIGEYIRAAKLVEATNFMSGITRRYAYKIEIDRAVRAEADLFSLISRDLVFRSPQIYQLEYKADYMLKEIFKAFQEHYLADPNSRFVLLPEFTEKYVRNEKDILRRARLICDYIAGMTDVFAIRTYKRLFDPDFGSIMDLV